MAIAVFNQHFVGAHRGHQPGTILGQQDKRPFLILREWSSIKPEKFNFVHFCSILKIICFRFLNAGIGKLERLTRQRLTCQRCPLYFGIRQHSCLVAKIEAIFCCTSSKKFEVCKFQSKGLWARKALLRVAFLFSLLRFSSFLCLLWTQKCEFEIYIC